MKKYIEREAARDLMEQALVDDWEIQYADDRLDEIPAADVVEVVRCKDCRWGKYVKSEIYNDSLPVCGYKNAHGMVVNETGYCAWGKRREEDT